MYILNDIQNVVNNWSDSTSLFMRLSALPFLKMTSHDSEDPTADDTTTEAPIDGVVFSPEQNL